MSSEFAAYKKFTDLDSAQEIIDLLKLHNIECRLLDETFANVKLVGYSPIDFGITINIKLDDFNSANQVLEQYYLAEIEKVDPSYYIFDFTNDELKEIVSNPYDWGEFDFHLAKKILTTRGIEINEGAIESRKKAKIAHLSQKVQVSATRIVTGYLFAFIFPPYSLLVGLLIVNNRNILPNGEKVYVHSDYDRTHGKAIVALSFAVAATVIALALADQM